MVRIARTCDRCREPQGTDWHREVGMLTEVFSNSAERRQQREMCEDRQLRACPHFDKFIRLNT